MSKYHAEHESMEFTYISTTCKTYMYLANRAVCMHHIFFVLRGALLSYLYIILVWRRESNPQQSSVHLAP
jgi:hypothetical protein